MERTWLHVAVLVGSILGLIGVVTLWPQAEKAPVAVSVDEQISLAKNLLLANQALRGEIERLDREVAEVWANRPAEVRPIVPKVTPKHAEAKPVAKRLPIVGERG